MQKDIRVGYIPYPEICNLSDYIGDLSHEPSPIPSTTKELAVRLEEFYRGSKRASALAYEDAQEAADAIKSDTLHLLLPSTCVTCCYFADGDAELLWEGYYTPIDKYYPHDIDMQYRIDYDAKENTATLEVTAFFEAFHSAPYVSTTTTLHGSDLRAWVQSWEEWLPVRKYTQQ